MIVTGTTRMMRVMWRPLRRGVGSGGVVPTSFVDGVSNDDDDVVGEVTEERYRDTL